MEADGSQIAPTETLTADRQRGQGGVDVWDDRHHIRENLRQWRRALSHWPERIPPDMLERIGLAINRNLDDDDARVVGGAIKSGLELASYRLKLLEVLDKMDRLDNGDSTENVNVRTVQYVIEEAKPDEPSQAPAQSTQEGGL